MTTIERVGEIDLVHVLEAGEDGDLGDAGSSLHHGCPVASSVGLQLAEEKDLLRGLCSLLSKSEYCVCVVLGNLKLFELRIVSIYSGFCV